MSEELRELTPEIKAAIKAGVLLDLHPSLLNNKSMIDAICKQREQGYIEGDLEVNNG